MTAARGPSPWPTCVEQPEAGPPPLDDPCEHPNPSDVARIGPPDPRTLSDGQEQGRAGGGAGGSQRVDRAGLRRAERAGPSPPLSASLCLRAEGGRGGGGEGGGARAVGGGGGLAARGDNAPGSGFRELLQQGVSAGAPG